MEVAVGTRLHGSSATRLCGMWQVAVAVAVSAHMPSQIERIIRPQIHPPGMTAASRQSFAAS